MAVQNQTPYNEYTANGSTTSFALGFDCESQNNLIVLIDDIETEYGSWYLENNTVIFRNAPQANQKISMQRNTPFKRETDFQSYDNSFRPAPVNKDFDRIWWKLQELGVADWLLRQYVDQKTDTVKNFLIEEIRKQGVALDQLEDYYNYLMERLAEIAVNGGWLDAYIATWNNSNQQEENKKFATTSTDLSTIERTGSRVAITDDIYKEGTGTPNGLTKIADSLGRIWDKVVIPKGFAYASQFGIKPNLSTSVGAQIQTAINTCASLGLNFCLDIGTYLTDVEIKIPSNFHFRGHSYNGTILKAHIDLPAIANVITNSTNTYEYRSTYNANCHVSDIQVDADWRGRYEVGTPINNQACGIKYSAVRGGSIKHVIVRNAALHCIDICADQYVYDGGVKANATNKSQNIELEHCYTFNPYRDDGVTFHNSENISVKHCYSTHDGSISVLDKAQQNGFEVDEGCSNVTVEHCVATGWAAGFQTKGHATTKPANQVTFDNCISDGCGNGFMVSVGTNPSTSEDWTPTGIRIVNCRDRNSNTTIETYPRAIYIYGADGVSIENFTCEGIGRIIMTQNTRTVSFHSIYFLSEIQSAAGGCIEMFSTAGANVSIKNVVSRVTQKIPLISKVGTSNQFNIDGVWGRGSAGKCAVQIEYGLKDSVKNINQTGYDGDVYLSGTGYNYAMSSVNIHGNHEIYIRNHVVNNAPVKAPQGTVARAGAQMWLQTALDGNTPAWKSVTLV